ncbi:dihydrolipoamide acetyltransferase family protein [Streptomyces sp. NPDC050264]|uniref:dihydrolipoamide acetyltransferase family protein n=1 Tax=Streptomyces sp. NPDC050264 TaxID=3155038 RepID=UPI00341F416C
MAQVLEFKLPDLGEGLTEAEIVRWLVSVGDVVAVDQPVVEVETAKALVEVPCPYGGVVTARFGDEGTELPVGSPLLTVAVDATEPTPGDTGPERSEGSGNVLVGYGTAAPPARRRRVRSGLGGHGGGERVATRGAGVSTGAGAPVAPTSPAPTSPARPQAATPPVVGLGPVPVVSPLVRKLAREHGLDLRELTGSGADGLILRADVERAVKARALEARAEAAVPTAEASAAKAPTVETPAVETALPGHRTPLRGIRGAVADKLSRSRREIPDATCWVDADATELMHARVAMNSATGPSAGPKISVLALLARICTAALARYPELNATVDMERREIVRLDEVHLGFAAQTERGLVVPVVRDAQARGAESLSAEFGRLTEAARTGTLTPGELTGGTFTLNNYGVFGVDGSTPIINHPEAAMLGVGRITPKPWVHEGELAVRQVVQLSLTFDHRVCDGGTAGGFLRYVADCVERPAVLLRTL